MSNREEVVRVIVADDQRLMRDGIASLLGMQEGLAVVATAANGEEALARALELCPDVILMDVQMPVMDGIMATARIRSQLPQCQILMLTTFDDHEYIADALQAGAIGYLLKDIPAEDLARAVKAAHKKIFQLDLGVAGKIIASFSQASKPTPSSGAPHSKPLLNLTVREIEVLRLVAKGATNREIAGALVLSESTVKNHISNILSSLGLRDRTQAAIFARENGLL